MIIDKNVIQEASLFEKRYIGQNGGTHDGIVIIGNELGNLSSNLEQGCLYFILLGKVHIQIQLFYL